MSGTLVSYKRSFHGVTYRCMGCLSVEQKFSKFIFSTHDVFLNYPPKSSTHSTYDVPGITTHDYVGIGGCICYFIKLECVKKNIKIIFVLTRSKRSKFLPTGN